MIQRTFAVFAVLFLFSANASAGFDGYVEITNKTGFTIAYLYVSHTTAKTWEEDVLDEDILRNGSTVRVHIKDAKSAIFDIRGTDLDGDTYTISDVDVSRRDVVLTLSDID